MVAANGGTSGHPGRARYDALRAAGVGRREAAKQVGVHIRTARDWDKGIRKIGNARLHPPDGRRIDYKTGVTTVDTRPSLARIEAPPLHPRFLTLSEREQIADMRRAGDSLREIGRSWVGRHRRSNEKSMPTPFLGVYRPHRAQRDWASSRLRPKDSKLAVGGPLRDYVSNKLAEQWSPEQISHTLIIEFPPDDEAMRVSTETIYQAIYVQARGGLRRELADALRTGRTHRKPHRSPRSTHHPVRRRDGDDFRSTGRGRGSGCARSLGG